MRPFTLVVLIYSLSIIILKSVTAAIFLGKLKAHNKSPVD